MHPQTPAQTARHRSAGPAEPANLADGVEVELQARVIGPPPPQATPAPATRPTRSGPQTGDGPLLKKHLCVTPGLLSAPTSGRLMLSSSLLHERRSCDPGTLSRPTEPVDLPEKTTVDVTVPESEAQEADNQEAIFAILRESYPSGESDVAERHNEHQP